MNDKQPPPPLKVEVSGGDQVTNSLVFGLVQTTLRGAGFIDLKVTHPFGTGESADTQEMSTMLDVLHVSHPKLFRTPVEVKQTVYRDMNYDYTRPQHLVESFVYGTADYEGQTHSTAEIHRTKEAKAFVARVAASQSPADRAEADREELEMETKFLKHLSDPNTAKIFEDLFGEKVDPSELEELRVSVEAKRRALAEAK